MNYWTLILTIFVADIAAVLSPGPDFLLTIRNTLRGSRSCGIATAVGISCGIAVHVVYCWVGVAMLVSNSDTLSNVLRWLGAAYLIWLGSTSIVPKQDYNVDGDAGATLTDKPTLRSSFLNGFITNLFNPKAFLFYISIYAVVLAEDTPFWVHATLAFLFVSSSLIWFFALSFLADLSFFRKRYESFEGLFNSVFGVLLIALGMAVLFF